MKYPHCIVSQQVISALLINHAVYLSTVIPVLTYCTAHYDFGLKSKKLNMLQDLISSP